MDHTRASTVENTLDTPDPAPSARRQALLRIAGRSAIVSGVAYALQPLIVMLIAPPGADVDYPDVAGLAAQRWQAPLEAAIFVVVGGGLLVTVLALHQLIQPRGTGIAGQVGVLGGVLSATGWFLLAGTGLGSASSVGMALGQAAPDPAIQRAVIQGGSITSWSMVSTAALGFLAWLVMLGWTGRRSGLFGLPLTVAVGVSALVVLVPLVVWSQAAGVLIMIPLLPLLAVRLLLSARRLATPDRAELG